MNRTINKPLAAHLGDPVAFTGTLEVSRGRDGNISPPLVDAVVAGHQCDDLPLPSAELRPLNSAWRAVTESKTDAPSGTRFEGRAVVKRTLKGYVIYDLHQVRVVGANVEVVA